MPSIRFRTLIAEKPSIEKRLLQLPFQFFLRSDLKQPTTNECGKRFNAPFHHVDNNLLNNVLNKLVEQKLLSIGNFISRPRAQPAQSYMKNPIPGDPSEQEQFLYYLEGYKINANEYQNLLARSSLPSRCILLSEAKTLLTSRVQHREDRIKYNLMSTVNINNDEASRGTIGLNFENVGNTTDSSLSVEMPVVLTTNNRSDQRHQLIDMSDNEDVLLNKNDDIVAKTSEPNEVLNSKRYPNTHPYNHQELLEDNLDLVQARQVEVTELIENNNKIPDVQRKNFHHNRERINDQPIGSADHTELETGTTVLKKKYSSKLAETTPSNNYTTDVRACVRVILQYPSLILSATDISLATRHSSAITRQRSIQLMIEKNLLREDDYLVRKLSESVKATKDFPKQVPRLMMNNRALILLLF